MSAARTNEPVTVVEAVVFAAAVVAPSWGLGVLIAALYVAGTSFLVILVPLALQPVSLLVGALAVCGVSVLVLRVQQRWTRPEIALVSSAMLAAALWATPVVLMSELGAGLVTGFILVVLGVCFGPIPVCFWSVTRMSRTMRIAVDDPAARSWLRDAVAWGVARYEVLRARGESVPQERAADELEERR